MSRPPISAYDRMRSDASLRRSAQDFDSTPVMFDASPITGNGYPQQDDFSPSVSVGEFTPEFGSQQQQQTPTFAETPFRQSRPRTTRMSSVTASPDDALLYISSDRRPRTPASLEVENARRGVLISNGNAIPTSIIPARVIRSSSSSHKGKLFGKWNYRRYMDMLRRDVRARPGLSLAIGLGAAAIGYALFYMLRQRYAPKPNNVDTRGSISGMIECLKAKYEHRKIHPKSQMTPYTANVQEWNGDDLVNILSDNANNGKSVVILFVKSLTCAACPDAFETFEDSVCVHTSKAGVPPHIAVGTIEVNELNNHPALINISKPITSTPTLLVVNRSPDGWAIGESFVGKPSMFDMGKFRRLIYTALATPAPVVAIGAEGPAGPYTPLLSTAEQVPTSAVPMQSAYITTPESFIAI